MKCFSLPENTAGLKEWSKFLKIQLESENGMVGGKQICDILDGMLKNNEELEISDYNIKTEVVMHFVELARKEKSGIIFF